MAILRIPITKAGNKPIEVDTDTDIPDAMYQLALEEGLKILLNKGMSKIATKGLEGDDLEGAKAAAFAKAEENFASLKEGKIKKGRATATDKNGGKVSGVVMTEARRLAKEVVKNEIRAAGMKISHVEASEITKAANALIAADPSFIETATANIEARAAKKVSGVDIASLIHESPKLVQAAEARKAASKTTLSAKQAGKAAPRKRAEAVAH
jgi:hypothetical protein